MNIYFLLSLLLYNTFQYKKNDAANLKRKNRPNSYYTCTGGIGKLLKISLKQFTADVTVKTDVFGLRGNNFSL